MKFAGRALSVGALSLALSAGGTAISLAWDQDNEPVLPSDGKHKPIPPFTLPSSLVPPDPVPYPSATDPTATTDLRFLTYFEGDSRRLDTPITACDYYSKIGAVTGCGPNGELKGAITFEKWKHDVGIDEYGPPGKTDVAHFVNQVDLNLTRNHHMISYGPNQLAGYVCNHEGPVATPNDPTGLFPGQHVIDAALRDIKRNQHQLACVAMEYSVQFGATSTNLPYTKFWIFSADGVLLSTVDLDGGGEKGVPNVCTACHGGTFNYETTATDGTLQFSSTSGDLEAHFLPFDMASFAFSSKVPEDQREAEIFKMNLNVHDTEMTRASTSVASQDIVRLIEGWYGGSGNVSPSNVAPQFHFDFVPNAWSSQQDVYKQVVAHSCRTCHVAMDFFPFESDESGVQGAHAQVCNEHVMPNSKVTFDRFWLSRQGLPAGTIDQVFLLSSLIGQPCNLP
jgi:hypothetical protein